MRARIMIHMAVAAAVALSLVIAYRSEVGPRRVASPAPAKAPAHGGQTQKSVTSSARSTGPSAWPEPGRSRRPEARAPVLSDRGEIANLDDAEEITSRAALERMPEGWPSPVMADDSMAESEPDPEEITRVASEGPILEWMPQSMIQSSAEDEADERDPEEVTRRASEEPVLEELALPASEPPPVELDPEMVTYRASLEPVPPIPTLDTE